MGRILALLLAFLFGYKSTLPSFASYQNLSSTEKTELALVLSHFMELSPPGSLYLYGQPLETFEQLSSILSASNTEELKRIWIGLYFIQSKFLGQHAVNLCRVSKEQMKNRSFQTGISTLFNQTFNNGMHEKRYRVSLSEEALTFKKRFEEKLLSRGNPYEKAFNTLIKSRASTRKLFPKELDQSINENPKSNPSNTKNRAINRKELAEKYLSETERFSLNTNRYREIEILSQVFSKLTSTPSIRSFEGWDFESIDFSRLPRVSKNERVDLSYCSFRKARLEKASLNFLSLHHTSFEHAVVDDWTEMSDIKATKANFNFLKTAGKSSADFANSVLMQASFKQAELQSANFYNADLRGADFSGACVFNVRFSAADLRGANLTSAKNLETAQFRGAKVDSQTKLPKGWTLKTIVRLGAIDDGSCDSRRFLAP